MFNHRLYVLEGVRAAAYANTDHLARTMRSFGIERFTTDASIVAVQNQMLLDQGLQPDATQRWLLGCTLANTWDVYLCLLFAEVESYRSMRTSFRHPELDGFIQGKSEAIRTLEALRDKLLHPKKDVRFDETLSDLADQTADGPHVFGRRLQSLLDQCLSALKDHLLDSFSNELAILPDNLLQTYMSRESSRLATALNRADDSDKPALRRLVDDHRDFPSALRLHPTHRNDPLDLRDRKHLRRLERAWTMLAMAHLPDASYDPATAIQTPIHPGLSSFIPSPLEPNNPFFGTKLPQFIGPARRDYLTLVLRSMLLFNESYQRGQSKLLTCFPGKSLAEIREVDNWETHISPPRSWDDTVTAASDTAPGMVALALLADPLKAYRRATRRAPELMIPEAERFVTDERTRSLYAWRNTIFHVPDSRIGHPDQLELGLLKTSPIEDYPSLITGLLRLFLAGDNPEVVNAR